MSTGGAGTPDDDALNRLVGVLSTVLLCPADSHTGANVATDTLFVATIAERLVDNANSFEYKEGTKVTLCGTQQGDTAATRLHTPRGANFLSQKGFALQNEAWVRVAKKRWYRFKS